MACAGLGNRWDSLIMASCQSFLGWGQALQNGFPEVSSTADGGFMVISKICYNIALINVEDTRVLDNGRSGSKFCLGIGLLCDEESVCLQIYRAIGSGDHWFCSRYGHSCRRTFHCMGGTATLSPLGKRQQVGFVLFFNSSLKQTGHREWTLCHRSGPLACILREDLRSCGVSLQKRV